MEKRGDYYNVTDKLLRVVLEFNLPFSKTLMEVFFIKSVERFTEENTQQVMNL